MTHDDILDIRSLADEWNDALVEASEGSPSYGEMAEIEGPCIDLCEQLGCETTPDGLSRYGDDYDCTLIRDDYFTRYAQELAEDIGAITYNESWPLDCIDWDRAARELQFDYMMVTLDGVDYWIHSA